MTQTAILAAVCVAAMLGGYGTSAQDFIDTTDLPRAEGARVVRAHPASTSFVTPGTVEDAAEAHRKILADAGWQQYDQISAAHPMPTRIMRFKKGTQGLSVFIMSSPTQGGATTVNYTAELLANDRSEPRAAAAPAKVESAAVSAAVGNGRTEPGEATPGLQSGRGAAQPDRVVNSSAAIAEEPVRTLSVHVGPMPLPASASNIEYDSAKGRLEFDSTSSVQALAAFYRDQLKPQGWREEPSVINQPHMVVLNLSRGDKKVSFTILQMGTRVNVSAYGSGLSTAARRESPPASVAKRDMPAAPAPAVAPAPVGAPGPVAAAAQADNDDLEVEESGGLPMPKSHISSTGANSPFRNEMHAEARLDLAVVLDFYRRELSKRGWKESAGAVIKTDQAVVGFTTADGPGQLRLGREDGKTVIALSLRKPDAAEKAGMLPKAGQAKLLLGNMTGEEAVITIDKRTIKVAAGAGRQSPDGPKIDLPPGKYTYTLKLASRAAQSQEVEVGADETWGLLVGPGGVLPMHLY
jgi:hypothetical protein